MSTDKRDEALKKALEALDFFDPPSADSIRKILAQSRSDEEQPARQQEPVALTEKIYEFVPTPEPVKWHHPECEGQCIACLIEQVVQEAYGSQGLGYLQRHLTSPPASKPLTDEQIQDLLCIGNPTEDECRLIGLGWNAAHGIKENKK